MQIELIDIKLENFGSYEQLDFDYYDLELSLISGEIGAGKSTLLDAPSWVLFGETPKGGNVDSVKNWKHSDKLTVGKLWLKVDDKHIYVHRERGNKNDLYWVEDYNPDNPIRGKDITETQQLLNKRLGLTYDFYSIISYFHEASPSNTFFLDKPKVRRELLEKLTNLTLPIKLNERIIIKRKDLKKQLQETETCYKISDSELMISKSHLNSLIDRNYDWEQKHKDKLLELTTKSENFDTILSQKIEALQTKLLNFDIQTETNKQKLKKRITLAKEKIAKKEEIENKLNNLTACKECGSPLNSDEKGTLIYQLNTIFSEESRLSDLQNDLNEYKKQINPYDLQLKSLKDSENIYAAQLKEEKKKINPFTNLIQETIDKIQELSKKKEEEKNQITVYSEHFINLQILQDLSNVLRNKLLLNSIKELEILVNKYLTIYFDSELLVSFELEDSDNLEVNITKNSYKCNFLQLSKGQRRLLRLVFAVAIMKLAANNCNVYCKTIMFDEALDGSSINFKKKAFSLFTELETQYSTVLIIDHDPEFQTLFSNKFHVSLLEDRSTVERV